MAGLMSFALEHSKIEEMMHTFQCIYALPNLKRSQDIFARSWTTTESSTNTKDSARVMRANGGCWDLLIIQGTRSCQGSLRDAVSDDLVNVSIKPDTLDHLAYVSRFRFAQPLTGTKIPCCLWSTSCTSDSLSMNLEVLQ